MPYPIAACRGRGGRAAPNLNAYADKIVALFGANIISYLPLWESSGAYAEDYSAANHDGQYSPLGGVTLGEPGVGDGRTSAKFDGINGFVNWYSAAFASAFNGQEGSLLLWAKVANAGVWSDGVIRYIAVLRVAWSNVVYIMKSSTSGRLEYQYSAGGDQEQYRKEGSSETGWMKLGITWSLSNNRVRFYYGGSQLGADVIGIGTWAGALLYDQCAIGAYSTSPISLFSGWVAHAVLLNREATPTEVANAATLPFELPSSIPYGSSIRTFYLASGGDINAACAQMRAGDVLELAAGGTYTIATDTAGFTGLPSGTTQNHTTIRGNGATVSGGDYAIQVPADYIDFENLNVRNGKFWALFVSNRHHVSFTDCDFYNSATGSAYDVCRVDNSSYISFTRCNAHSTTDFDGPRAHDGFEMWGPCDHITFTDCKAYNIKNGATDNEGHGFEVYGQLAGEIASNVTFTNCEAYNTQVGFSVEGGPLSLAHTNIVCDGCSSHDNAFYGYQGVQGATLTRSNVAGHNNADNGVSETNGSVVDV